MAERADQLLLGGHGSSGGLEYPPVSRPPRVLFLTPDVEDYLADSLLHGLRQVLGEQCVDWPKREVVYDTFPADRRPQLYGRGFTLYGGLPEGTHARRGRGRRAR